EGNRIRRKFVCPITHLKGFAAKYNHQCPINHPRFPKGGCYASISKDVSRVFQYHGAEHKVIYAYEAGVEMTPENVGRYSILHPRCGTSFLLIVMVMSILIFSFIPQSWTFTGKFLSRVVLIPLIAGLSYEFIKFSSKKIDNPFIKILIAPGLSLQRLTAKVPTSDQIEVAIIALKEVLLMESGYAVTERDKNNNN
ncbi:MAG: DUF1385 domain-containing protein, partial [Nitrospirae bacterium]|nr:DUF1385 domain-containing protein [Nitrospirota bacterium]